MIDPTFYCHNFPDGFSPAMVQTWLKKAGIGVDDLPTAGSEILLTGVATLLEAGPRDLAYLDGAAYVEDAQTTGAGACLVTPDLAPHLPEGVVKIIVVSPRRAWACVVGSLYALRACDEEDNGAAAASVIHPSARIGDQVVIGPRATIGANTTLEPGCVIGPGVQIGEDCHIEALASLKCARIGRGCRIGPGARIGQEGFGFIMDDQGHITMPHVGTVRVEDDVRIGANTCIDRGTLGETVIGEGCRLDNLVQIAHNVQLGGQVVLAAQVGIAGSVKVGAGVVMGGQAGLAQHLSVGDGAQIAAQSGVMRDVPAYGVVGGSPAVPIKQWHRQQIFLQRGSDPKGSSIKGK